MPRLLTTNRRVTAGEPIFRGSSSSTRMESIRLGEDLRKTPAAICPVTLHGAEDHDCLVVETVRNYYMDRLPRP